MPASKAARVQLGEERDALLHVVQLVMEEPDLSDSMKSQACLPLLEMADKRARKCEDLTPPQRQRRSLKDHRKRMGEELFAEEFRFLHTHIPQLMELLQIPDSVQLPGRG
eukprot:TRINITY_DN318_c0_g1_i1.p2 TRINITY_DN318_c0_g1~~TRINITY_DN318_c0_g1_i1.p2  ORF type:complete len:110 (-),score=15.09 TRINITY_DN318_c0_g1_i1:1371-1700(-)